MKRSDSVNKRFSGQPAQGLSRQDSVGGVKGGMSGSNSMPRLDQASDSVSRENSQEAGSRPSSSHSIKTITQERDGGFVKPSLPSHSRSKSNLSLRSDYEGNAAEQATPTSPSKRWSPTKSSWLESAINKPESPKPKAQTSNQPSWMAEISKTKQQKASQSGIDVSALDRPPSSPTKRATMSPPVGVDIPSEVAKVSPTSREPILGQLASKAAEGSKHASTSSISSLSSKARSPPPEVKPKPETPPKNDFRANLRSRQISNDSSANAEPEFKNALGKLRRTETKNYVAPETFTDNIKRGKNALNITGGVPPRVKRDELKEQLLAQKEAMKAKKEAEAAEGKPVSPPVERNTDIPEALAARRKMNVPVVDKPKPSITDSHPASVARNSSWTRPTSSSVQHDRTPSGLRDSGPARANEGVAQSSTPKPTPPASSSSTPSQSPAPNPMKAAMSSKLAERFNPNLASMLARGPPPSGGAKRSDSGDGTSTASTARNTTSEPKEGAPLEHMTKGRARGPKRRAPVKTDTTAKAEPLEEKAKDLLPRPVSLVKEEMVLGSDEPPKEVMKTPDVGLGDFDFGFGATPKKASPVRTAHVEEAAHAISPPPIEKESPKIEKPKPLQFTKTLGKSVSAPEPVPAEQDADKSPVEEPTKKPYSSFNKAGTASFADQIARRAGGQPSASQRPLPSLPLRSREVNTPPAVSQESSKPRSPAQKSVTGMFASQIANKINPSASTPPAPLPKDVRKPESPAATVPAKLPSRPSSPEKMASSVSVKDSAALWGKPTPSPTRSGPSSPVKLPTRTDEEDAMRDAAGLAAPFQSPKKATSSSQEMSVPTIRKDKAPEQRMQHPMSPPSSAGLFPKPNSRPKSPMVGESNPVTPRAEVSNRSTSRNSITLKPPAESPVPHTSEAMQLFTDFFTERPVMPASVDVDTQALLTDYPLDTSKIRTTRKQIQEISNDGKMISLPPNEEYILFEDSMYAITHAFERSNGGKASEVYLWTGSNVPASAAEDAQLFGRRVAKDNSAKLNIVAQGKETPAFFQALGGILITRRGARSQRHSTQQFMLCGRKHVGHIAFDEVDFSLRSFCSGFPFLVFAGGKLHLWKGVGCTAEEIGCARLIAMDIGITPDVVEVVEGKEPQSFIDLFPQPEKGPKKIFASADHWARKASCERYRTRLFKITTNGKVNAAAHARHPSTASTGGFQVSSLWPPFLGRRPSWSANSPTTSTSAASDRSSSPPQTPKTPASMLGQQHAGPPKISEIAPYTQRDVEGVEGVFVLDAFFEVYMYVFCLYSLSFQLVSYSLAVLQCHDHLSSSLNLVSITSIDILPSPMTVEPLPILTFHHRILTSQSRHAAAAFTTALLFAQDYGILAASLEDRPFVPISTVVVEGAPRDMKACFRHWDDTRWVNAGAGSNMSVGEAGANGSDVKRGKSLRVVGLDAAIAATMGGGR